MKKTLKKFGRTLKELRVKKGLTLRKASKLANYDPSNWSKIERGKKAAPSNETTLKNWAKILGVFNNKIMLQKFIDEAKISQGIIPDDILNRKELVENLPAFFRTLRNKKPTKEEIDQLIELIKEA